MSPRPLLYETLRPIVGIALHWYYRSLNTANLDRIPRDGPVFLAANHPNSLTDAMVVGWIAPRRVQYTAKATLFGNPLAARFLRAVGVIPLRRAADERAADERAASASSAAATAARQPKADAAVPDAARNAASFSAVADALASSACIVVFPEGKTHDEPYMAPLKTGLARMALMARDDRGVRGIRIVPVGLLFERKEEPRSRILVQVGEPIDLDRIGSGATTVATLTELIDLRLRAVTLNFENHADAERIQLLSDTLVALVEPESSIDEGAPPLARTMAVVRRIERAHDMLRTRGDADLVHRIEQFEARLRAFRLRLQQERIDVHDVHIDVSVALGARFVVRELCIAAVMLPVSAWGRVTHVLPIQLARALALRNVQARDEPPMRTFILGLVLVLATYIAFTTAVAWACGPWWAVLFFLTLIPSASSDLRYGDRVRRARARARAYRLFRATPALQASLLADAEFLRSEAGALEQLSLA